MLSVASPIVARNLPVIRMIGKAGRGVPPVDPTDQDASAEDGGEQAEGGS